MPQSKRLPTSCDAVVHGKLTSPTYSPEGLPESTQNCHRLRIAKEIHCDEIERLLGRQYLIVHDAAGTSSTVTRSISTRWLVVRRGNVLLT